jgi:ABC-type tungstate transport system permease subunit
MDHLAAANLGESDGVLVHSKKNQTAFLQAILGVI